MKNDIIKITEIEEHEDGSATLQVECDPETFMAIFDVGFVTLIKAGLEKEKKKMGRYVVEIELEKGEYTFVRKEDPWTYDTEVWIFSSRKDAEREAKKWNTGRVVEYL